MVFADMAELVDATDLKSVEDFPRAGSIPAFRTNYKSLKIRVFFDLFFYPYSNFNDFKIPPCTHYVRTKK